MTRQELDAAGIDDPALRSAYSECRRLNAVHGRTYFLATKMLSLPQRPAVHALYGFARWLDDLVDEPAPGTTTDRIAARLSDVETRLFTGLATGHSDDPLLSAVIDTTKRYAIPTRHFSAFLRSMRMDLTVEGYPDRGALDEYVHGSAEVIGLQVLPILGVVSDHDEAASRAAALGKAFQLTNFLRDVAEDLGRNRVYLPADELASFGVDRDRLRWCATHQRVDPAVKRALADQIATTRAIYRVARPGVALLHPVSRPCVATALALYSEILDRIEDVGHNVFARRATVPDRRRLVVASGALLRALWARRRHTPPTAPTTTAVS
ncbi:phytoene/squalene synthase family protein [Amycolatopsis sp. H20-H5]|uniref:phytoene/squalene synthase family protein n=1 Tax=Amycolatopsis sp. H20-H5 TaxID=3046309 RepID=UPI002DBEFF7A|nr:phytoene/squalene synthase family protein [Amycolatopsis sp. H20-H5]MEC3982489.1 phytoene/squalene synthase family protein [Amycolatopsis sp. H20-H5]